MHLLITYDIVSDKKRKKIDKLLSEYGVRVNYSVFEVQTDSKGYKRLTGELPGLMGPRDSVRIYRFSRETITKSQELNPKLSHPFSMEESYVL